MPAAFRLEGSSMLPVFKPGEVVIVQPFNFNPSIFSLSAGDCAVYSYKGRTLLHRVISLETLGAWMADDAGLLEPHFVPWTDIKGRPLSGHPLSFGLPGRLYSGLRRALSPVFNRN